MSRLVGVEHKAKQVRRRTNIQKVLLHTIAGAGLLSVGLLAPNALQVLRMFDGGKKRTASPKYLIGNAFEKLLARDMVEFVTTEKGKFIRITEDGRLQLARLIARSPDTRKLKRWDKRWRVVVYDIAERKKTIRDKLLRTMRTFGFYKLQNSVWVYPYDCEALMVLLKAELKIGKEVQYMVVEVIENDKALREHFELR